MNKIKIAPGIYWVEIPEAELYILCGCPADSIKHLIKKGLIVTKEKDGISYETGPNAILLSDLPLQNEHFSNLSEFPVLHMFYRQGMILPNHPNNTGTKPILIGTEEQVMAQIEYIYRGNYGLSSKEEIMDGGISEERANEMMRLKLKFAFDKIRKIEELIEARIVGKEKVELRRGVFVKREGVNLYRFEYKGQTVGVDLNLSSKEEYEAPYQLSYHKIRREYFSVVHIGEGDGWDQTRPCMGSILTFQGKIYLVDAGPNIVHSLRALGMSANEIEGIFHTHNHDDHFSGLTVLMQSDHRIKYYTTPLVRKSVMKKLSALLSIGEREIRKYFKIQDLEFDRWNNIDGLEVMPVFSPHPVETNIMFFRTMWENGYKIYAHLADIVSFDVLKKMVANDSLKSGISEEFYHKIEREYLTPVDLKKIDIGGGLIHGRAENFVKDKSAKILLSHTSLPLTDKQKEIGDSTSFGAVDVLIPAQQDYPMQSAFKYLSSYFPSVPEYELRMLLNCSIVSFNPGSILIKKGTVNRNIFLILSGVLEFIESKTEVRNRLSAGEIAGELSGITGIASPGTYRAISYIVALQIPCDLYIEFAKRNSLYEDIKNISEKRYFLQNTWIFGEMTSYAVKNKISKLMKSNIYYEGNFLHIKDKPKLYIIKDGEVEIYSKNKKIETITYGGFYGEESILKGVSKIFKAKVIKQSEIYEIPGDLLAEIPVVRWKLFETFTRRKIIGAQI